MDETAARAKLAAFVTDLDARFRAADGVIGPWCVFANGDKVFYDTWRSGVWPTPDMAVDDYIKTLRMLGRGPPGSPDEQVIGRIIWRIRPGLETRKGGGGWKVYSRFVVSTFEPVAREAATATASPAS